MNNGAADFAASLQNMISDTRARDSKAGEFYALLKKSGKLESHRVLTYRCRSRCLLLDVLNTREGIIVHVPRYRLSPQANAISSTESGRVKNTEDNDRRWKERTFFLADAIDLACNCDHVRQYVVTMKQLQEDLIVTTRREVTIRP